MRVKLLNNTECPRTGRSGDAGYDFFLNKDVVIKPRQQVIIDTGVCIELPYNHAGLFQLRSSICKNYKHLILKNPLIDSNYRGELHILVYNDSFSKKIKFKKGERIASLFVFPVYTKPLLKVKELSETNRGNKAFGSSGK